MDERIYGLLGRKLGHSWSVPIHAALGNGAYRLLELEPDGLAPFLHRKDIGGLNVTIPYKRDVMPLCDEIDPAAEAIGSVNTIVRCADGKLVGYNTDIDGFLYMACRAGISLSGKKVVILGSGGASLTAQTAARQGGAAEVVVVSRFGPDNYDNLSRHADAEILVNATPVGMYPGNGQSPVDLSVFPVCQGVLDVIYNPRRTALLLQAEARSIPCSDGLPMLVAQAVAAEERFFNRSIPAGENERILVQLRREMTNLILIGMPGSGKTTVGEALSRLTGREAVDLDQMIETTAGCSIPEIFQREGESGFRARERAAAEEAASVGKFTAAHCTGLAGAMNAIRAGVNIIEHAQLDEPTAEALARSGAAWCPTIVTRYSILHTTDPAYQWMRAKADPGDLVRKQKALMLCKEYGIPVIAGTDAGPNAMVRLGEALWTELGIYQEYGMTAQEVLHACTAGAAEILRIGETTGSVRTGLAADLALFEGDVTADVTAVKTLCRVWQGGVQKYVRL